MDTDVMKDIRELSNPAGFFNPFRVLHSEGGELVYAMTSTLLIIAISLCALFLAARLVQIALAQTGDDGKDNLILGAIDCALVVMVLTSYHIVIPLLPEVFTAVGRKIFSADALSTTYQIGDVLQTLGEEDATEFKFLTGNLFSYTATGLLSAIFCVLSLMATWFLSSLQGYLFAIWYVLGPILIPFYLYHPTRLFAVRWYMSLIATSFWTPLAGVMLGLLVKTDLLRSGYYAGLNGDYFASIAMSVIIILGILMIPGITAKLFGGIMPSAMRGVHGASKGFSTGLATGLAAGTAGGRAASALGKGLSKMGGAVGKNAPGLGKGMARVGGAVERAGLYAQQGAHLPSSVRGAR